MSDEESWPEVVCPTCCERFGVPLPAPDELPTQMDYDCEICCRPLVLSFRCEGDQVIAEARGLDE